MRLLPWIILIMVILVLDIVAVSWSFSGDIIGTESYPMTVSQLFENGILNETYYVTGTVSSAMDEYVSRQGYHYSQFHISDGEEEIKFFCSRKYGDVEVREGDYVRVEGKFQKFYNQLELYGFCSEIRVI